MTKEQYFNLKDELKELAIQIRQLKPQFKSVQRDLSKYELNVITIPKDYHWESKKLEGWFKLVRPVRSAQSDLFRLKHEYRAKHILYSLARGRTINQIEPKIKDVNDYGYILVYETLIPKYVKQYDFDNTDILPNRTQKSMGLIDFNGQNRMFTHEEMRMAR